MASTNRPEAVWRTACDGVPGSPVIFPKWTFLELRNLPDGKGGSYIIKKHPEHLHMVNVRDMYELRDIDRPEDLKE